MTLISAAAQSQDVRDSCPPATTQDLQQPATKRKAVQLSSTPAKAKPPKNNSGKKKARKT